MDLGVDGADEKDGNPVEDGSRSEDISKVATGNERMIVQ